MKITAVPKEEKFGEGFSSFELSLSDYPTEVPCCCHVNNIDLMYIGNKNFKIINIGENYSVKTSLTNTNFKKGDLVIQYNCGSR
jgi:hypothetical protein